MDVDEAGRDDAPGRVDALNGFGGGEVPQRRYAAITHPDVRTTAGCAKAINECPVAQDEVEHDGTRVAGAATPAPAPWRASEVPSGWCAP